MLIYIFGYNICALVHCKVFFCFLLSLRRVYCSYIGLHKIHYSGIFDSYLLLPFPLPCLNLPIRSTFPSHAVRSPLAWFLVNSVLLLWGGGTQLLIITEVLWSQPVHQIGRPVVVARNEIRVVRRVEILQQCSSTSSCMGTRIVMVERYTERHHSATPCVLNGTAQFFFN
jgi:hypothetical protein